ncbi:MAG: hypothetical protein M0Z30_10060 [Actinomycetota bacterium]|nr:hypothetical protein [Actinomycetota bacterium]
MQPVQLSLTAEAGTLPPLKLAESLPPALLDAATVMLADLIAKAWVEQSEEDGGE